MTGDGLPPAELPAKAGDGDFLRGVADLEACAAKVAAGQAANAGPYRRV